jgi:hypothetical protein
VNIFHEQENVTRFLLKFASSTCVWIPFQEMFAVFYFTFQLSCSNPTWILLFQIIVCLVITWIICFAKSSSTWPKAESSHIICVSSSRDMAFSGKRPRGSSSITVAVDRTCYGEQFYIEGNVGCRCFER